MLCLFQARPQSLATSLILMLKRETLRIVLITFAVLAVIVINALIISRPTPDIIDAPIATRSAAKVPDFSAYTNVDEKKAAFFDYLRPEVIKQNNYLLTLRHYVQTLYRQVLNKQPLNANDRERLQWLTQEYRVDDSQTITLQLLSLLKKIDVVPIDLVLVQAANESAWGTSRFAKQGFNFYGLWCFSEGCGFVPSRRQPGLTHEVAKFDNVSKATYTYMRNLNRHEAYSELREIRSRLRANQIPINGVALAEGLMNYSERGAAYVEELQNMIRYNEEYLSE